MSPNKKNQYLNLLLDKHGLETRIEVSTQHQPSVHMLFSYIHRKILGKIESNEKGSHLKFAPVKNFDRSFEKIKL